MTSDKKTREFYVIFIKTDPVWDKNCREFEPFDSSSLRLGWIPRNFQTFILKPKLSFLREKQKNDRANSPYIWFSRIFWNGHSDITVVCLKSGLLDFCQTGRVQKIRTFMFSSNRACPKNSDIWFSRHGNFSKFWGLKDIFCISWLWLNVFFKR